MKKLCIYAIHPIMYQVPIFAELDRTVSGRGELDYKVLFGDDISIRSVYFPEFKTYFKPDTPFLLEGYKYAFLRNWSKDSRAGFWSRINPGIIKDLLLNRYDAVLIHGYESLTAWLAYLGAKLTRTRILWRGESVLKGDEGRPSPKKRFKEIVLRRFFAGCDAILYSCSGNRDYLRFYGVAEDKLFSIPCAVNNEFFQAERARYAPRADAIRAELGIDPGRFVVLFSARLTRRKRPYDLIEAAARIDHRNLTLLFVGNGPEKDEMERRASEKGLHAVFTGMVNQSEISRYYAIADVKAVISEYDPSPKALNEAMNFEVPVLVTDVVGTARDLVEDGRNGYVIKVGDVEALADRLDRLNRDREAARGMGRESLRIVDRWNYRADVDGILSAFAHATRTLR